MITWLSYFASSLSDYGRLSIPSLCYIYHECSLLILTQYDEFIQSTFVLSSFHLIPLSFTFATDLLYVIMLLLSVQFHIPDGP